MTHRISHLKTLAPVFTGALLALGMTANAASPDAGAAEASPGEGPPEDYSAGVRWFFVTLDRDVPSHRLARHFASDAAQQLGGQPSANGRHVSNAFPAGAWLDTSANAARVHTRIRERAGMLGDIPPTPAVSNGHFPLTASAEIRELQTRGNSVGCRVRLRLEPTGDGAEEVDTKTTRFTGRGGASGMHVFVAAIPDPMVAQAETLGAGAPGSSYLVLTVNVGAPENPGGHQVTRAGVR